MQARARSPAHVHPPGYAPISDSGREPELRSSDQAQAPPRPRSIRTKVEKDVGGWRSLTLLNEFLANFPKSAVSQTNTRRHDEEKRKELKHGEPCESRSDTRGGRCRMSHSPGFLTRFCREIQASGPDPLGQIELFAEFQEWENTNAGFLVLIIPIAKMNLVELRDRSSLLEVSHGG